MKRDMNLIRLLLLRSEGDPKAVEDAKLYTDDQRVHHVAMLVDAGFIEATLRRDPDKRIIGSDVHRITWKGYEFLDAMRDEGIWKKAQDTLLKPIGGIAFEVLLEWLKWQMREKLSLPNSSPKKE